MPPLRNLVFAFTLLAAGQIGVAQTPTLPLAAPAGGALALGEDFSVGLRYDGIARSWGTNDQGQLGTAAALTVVQPVPTQLRLSSATALSGVARIYAGRQHGLLINTAANGAIYAWGRNDSGQLGDGTTALQRAACVTVKIAAGSTTQFLNVVSASAGYAHSLALKSDGTVWAWGNNASGQVGDNSTTNRLAPLRITPAAPVFPNTFQAVAAGHDHSLALRNDGTVWAWGANAHGQLGTGNTTASLVPVQVQNLPGGLTVTAIAAGNGFSVALLSDGTVRAWGRGDKGQLGHDDDTPSSSPVQPLGLGNTVTAIAAGDDHVLARKADGSVWGWGSNFAGELGGIVPAAQFTPQPVPGLANVAVIDAGAARSGAVLSDGAILLWGDPAKSALGPASLGYESVRVQIQDVKRAASIYAGGDQAALVRDTKRAYLFGRNAFSQLGTGTPEPVVAPARILDWPTPNSTTAPLCAFGAAHALALVDGVIYAAGDNTYGQLGDGTASARSLPVSLFLSGSPIIQVVAGWNHSLALRADGTVLVWGRNDFAQLGLGATSSNPSLIPVALPGLTDVVALAAGEAHSLALKSDGTVWAWGDNAHGQTVGTGAAPIVVPTQVTGPASIAAIAAGANHSLALTSAAHPTTASRNRVYAWGRGTYGQIGNNTTTARVTTPAFLANTGLVGIAAGENHSVARKGDGTVVAWGRNHRGQVGNAYVATFDAETTAKVLVPTAVNSITTTAAVSAIAAGFNTSYAIYGNATLWGWGDASRQQLGYVPSRLTPLAWRLTNNSADPDADGMLNTWETARFGTTSKAGYEDTDLDGLLDIQEHYYGSLPANYPEGIVGADFDYDLLNDFADSDRNFGGNGNSYTLSVPFGNAQLVAAGATSPIAVTVQAHMPNGYPLGLSVPVYIRAIDPEVFLSVSPSVPAGSGAALDITTTETGEATFSYRQKTPAGASVVIFQMGVDVGEVYIFPPAASGQPSNTIDSDGDGLPDYWEISHFGGLSAANGKEDGDGDGYSTLEESLLGLNPNLAEAPASSSPKAMTYDGLNRLISIGGGATASYNLDAEGNIK